MVIRANLRTVWEFRAMKRRELKTIGFENHVRETTPGITIDNTIALETKVEAF